MSRAFESILAGHIYVPPLVSDVTVKPSVSSVVTPSSSAALTDRQFEVLKLVAAGRSNKEIARSLFIAEGTVKVHITAAFRALGVHNRVSAAAALRNQPRNDNASQVFFPGLFAEESEVPSSRARWRSPPRPIAECSEASRSAARAESTDLGAALHGSARPSRA